MTPSAHLETRQVLQPSLLIVLGYNVPGWSFSSSDDDFITKRDAAGIPVRFTYSLDLDLEFGLIIDILV